MRQKINGKVYDTEKATLIASDYSWNGNNYDRKGRNKYLYKTTKGNYFAHYTTKWQNERDFIQALPSGKAKAMYESLPEHETDYETAFGEPEEEA